MVPIRKTNKLLDSHKSVWKKLLEIEIINSKLEEDFESECKEMADQFAVVSVRAGRVLCISFLSSHLIHFHLTEYTGK